MWRPSERLPRALPRPHPSSVRSAASHLSWAVTCPPFFSVSLSFFFKSVTACFSPTLLQLLLPTEALFCHFRGLLPLADFSLDQILGFLSGWNRRGLLRGRPRLGELVWNGRPIGSQASAFSHFCPLRPSCPPPHTPKLRRTPRGWGPYPLAPGTGLASASRRRGDWPSEGPLSPVSHSQGPQRRVEFLLWDSFVPPHSCSFSHCDFALLPTQPGCGPGAPQEAWLGASARLSYF